MEALFYVLLFVTLLSFFYLLYMAFVNKRISLKQRLTYIRESGGFDYVQEEAEENMSFSKRVIRPFYEQILQFVGRIAPSSIRTEYENLLNASGLRKKFSYTNVIMIQFLLAALLLAVFLSWSQRRVVEHRTFLMVGVGLLGFYLPFAMIRQKATLRKVQIQKELPGFLDLVYVSVEAGLSFDMAIQRTMERMKGPLMEEFGSTMEEIRHGRERSNAFRALAQRTQVEDVNTFIASIIQAEELGAKIGNVLRVQAHSMRLLRKQRAEETAAKIPTKMTLPLVLLIFPSLFIVILGPAIINMIESFLS